MSGTPDIRPLHLTTFSVDPDLEGNQREIKFLLRPLNGNYIRPTRLLHPQNYLHLIAEEVRLDQAAPRVVHLELHKGNLVRIANQPLPEITTRVTRLAPSIFLASFRFFCRGAAREDVDQTIADLKRDCREMRRKGHSAASVRNVVLVQSVLCVLAIVWRGVRAVATVWSPVPKA